MLIEKNVKDKRKSWYVCDRCGKKMTSVGKNVIYANQKKKWDLCLTCLQGLNTYVERGKNEYIRTICRNRGMQ